MVSQPTVTINPGILAFEEKEPEIIIKAEDDKPKYTWQWDPGTYLDELKRELAELESWQDPSDSYDIKWLRSQIARMERRATHQAEVNYRRSNSNVHINQTAAKKTQAQAAKLITALSPRTTIRWHTTDLDTDFSTWDAKTKTWTITLDPRRFLFENKRDQNGRTDPTQPMIQSTIGAAIHEVSHTLYTPGVEQLKDFVGTFEALAIFRIYEDAYINSQIIVRRLPGAKPLLESANAWTNPSALINDHIQQNFQPGIAEPEAFETWVNVLAWMDYVARWHHDTPWLQVPSQTAYDIYTEVEPITTELMAGEFIEPERRAEMYQEIADIISKRFPPTLHQDIPDCVFETVPDKDEDGNPNKHAGATRTPLDQKIDDGYGTPEEDLETLRETISDILRCSQTGSTQTVDPTILQQLQNINTSLEVAETDGISGLDNIDYTRAEPNEFPKPQVDENRINRLRNIFKARAAIRRQYIHGMTEGRLSLRKLHKLARTHGKVTSVFKRRPNIDTPAAAILLLVDGSGSMTGAPYDTASQSAKELYLALRNNPDYKLHVWAYSSAGQSVSIRAATPDGAELHWPNFLSGGTPTYEAMDTAHKFLLQNYKNQNRIIIHFTDLGFGDNENCWSGDILRDERLRYMTVAVTQGTYHARPAWLEAQKANNPALNISYFDTNELVKAVQEFITEIA